MKSARQLIVVIVLAASLGPGCVTPPTVVVVNNTGRDLMLRVAAENYGAAPRDQVVILKQGADHTFLEGAADIRGVQVVAGNCVDRYDLPQLDDPIEPLVADGVDRASRYLHYPVVVQLERDRKLYLADLRGRLRGAGGRLEARQVLGFPLRPTSSTCR